VSIGVPEQARQSSGVQQNSAMAGRDRSLGYGGNETGCSSPGIDRVEDHAFGGGHELHRRPDGLAEVLIPRSYLIPPQSQVSRRDLGAIPASSRPRVVLTESVDRRQDTFNPIGNSARIHAEHACRAEPMHETGHRPPGAHGHDHGGQIGGLLN
jgi:hypothetical protein